MKNLLYFCLLALSVTACQPNSNNTDTPLSDSTNVSVTTTVTTPSAENVLPEGYIKIAYPLEVAGAEGSNKTLENLKSAGFDVMSMGNPNAKKGLLTTEDGILLSVAPSETVSMGNYEVTFKVVDKDGNKVGEESDCFIYSGSDEGYMNSQISIKNKTITISSKEYEGKKLVEEKQKVLKITAEGLIE